MSAIVNYVMRAVAARPGSLFQPVFVCPTTDAQHLIGELKNAAREHGQRVFSTASEWRMAGETSGIVVCRDKEIEQLDAAGRDGRIQVVSWGNSISALSPGARRWVEEEGIVLDPLSASEEEGVNLHHVARAIERARHGLFVLLVKNGSEMAITHNLRIRLEALGEKVTLAPARREDSVTIFRVTDKAGARSLAEYAERGDALTGLLIAVTNPNTWAAASRGAAWTQRARVLPLGGEKARVEEEGTWPLLTHLLSCLPEVGTVDTRRLDAWTGWNEDGDMELVNLIQQVARPGASSDITVFSNTNWGRLKIRGALVEDIDMAGEKWDERKLETVRKVAGRGDDTPERIHHDLLIDRFYRIVQWPEARVVASKVADEARSTGVNAGDLAFELIGWIDERKERPKPRGGGAVWQSQGAEPKESALAFARQIWGLADGRRTSWQIDDILGFGRNRILDILASMELSGYVKFVSEAAANEEPPLEDVVSGLLKSGFVEEAKQRLEKTKTQGALSVRGHSILAGILAITDGARSGVSFMRYASDKAATTDWLAARLDLALLVARSGAWNKEAWTALRAELVAHSATNSGWGYKQYGIWGELAIRSGEEAQARKVIQSLRSTSLPLATGIGNILDMRLKPGMDGGPATGI